MAGEMNGNRDGTNDADWEPVTDNAKAKKAHDDELAAWWKEDAERHNELGDIIKKAGHQLPVSPTGPPPELDPETGAMKEVTDNAGAGDWEEVT